MQKSEKGRIGIKTILIVVIAVLALGLGATAYMLLSQNDILPSVSEIVGGDNEPLDDGTFAQGVQVDGVDISMMTMEQAKADIHTAQQKALEGKTIELTLDDEKISVSLNTLNPTYNTDEVLSNAMNVGRTGTKEEQQAERALAAEQGVSFSTEMTIDEAALQAHLESLTQPLSVEPINAAAQFNKDLPERFEYVSEVEGRAVDIPGLTTLVKNKIDKADFTPVAVPYNPVEAEITVEKLQTQVVKVSSFTTSFKKSPYNNPNRVFNIVREAEMINGTVLMPGDVFDINQILGPRTAKTGWKEANGIRSGRYELEPGGGVCQGSSTLYNAVSMADLEIVERKPHSWPLSYVPIGRDATISTGGPNFRFKNSTNSPIYIVAYTDEKEKTVTYEIWGEPLPDGITEIKLVSKKTGTLQSPGTEYIEDPTLAPGTQTVHVEERKGAVAETYKEYYKGEELVKREHYTTDRYPAFKGITYVGPALPAGYTENVAAAVPAQ